MKKWMTGWWQACTTVLFLSSTTTLSLLSFIKNLAEKKTGKHVCKKWQPLGVFPKWPGDLIHASAICRIHNTSMLKAWWKTYRQSKPPVVSQLNQVLFSEKTSQINGPTWRVSWFPITEPSFSWILAAPNSSSQVRFTCKNGNFERKMLRKFANYKHFARSWRVESERPCP